MLRIFFKALIVIWPFLKSAIFKDRTVGEVLAENKHITVMLVLNVVMIVSLVLTTEALAYYKDEYLKAKAAVTAKVVVCIPEEPFEDRKRRFMDILVDRSVP